MPLFYLLSIIIYGILYLIFIFDYLKRWSFETSDELKYISFFECLINAIEVKWKF